ncbi:MAG: hypothetical protein K6A77_07365 [Clostridiales bacterium]|nr:hypothetical protein [Clostridiales bacterium]
MDKQWVRQNLAQREVRFRDIFVWSFELLRERIGQYIFLTIAVFLPSNLLVSLLLQKLPDAVTLNQYVQVSALQLLANLFAMIACSVCVIMVDDQLSEEKEEKPFGLSFYEGIRTWPMFLLTTVMLMAALFGIVLVIMMLSSFLPILMLPAMIAVVILALLLVVFMYGANVTAARHSIMLRRNLEMVLLSLKDHLGKTVGLLLLVTLIGLGLSAPLMTLFDMLIGGRLTGIPLLVIETALQTVLSIVNIYADIAVCLRFLNLEQIRTESRSTTIM